MMLFKSIINILTIEDRKSCIVLFVLVIIGSFFEAIGIGAIFPFLSILDQQECTIQNRYRVNFFTIFDTITYRYFIVGCALVLVAFYFVKNGYLIWMTKKQIRFVLQMQIRYGKQLFASYLLKPYSYHLNHNTASILKACYNGPIHTFSFVFLYALLLLTEIVTAVGIVILLLFVDITASLMVFGLIGGLVYLILRVFRNKIAHYGETQNEYAGIMYQWVNQGLGAVKETKILGREDHFYKSYSLACERFGIADEKFRVVNAIPRFIIETVVVFGLLFLIIINLFLGTNTSEIVPTLGVMALAAVRLMPCANRCINYYNIVKFYAPLFQELLSEFLSIKNSAIENGWDSFFLPCVSRMSFNDEISINHLKFQYTEGDDYVLNGVSFTIPKGKYVGIIGQSGAGKTTLVDILLGLLFPSEGKVLVDGNDISQNIRGWQKNLSYVPQDIYLIDGTIKENIALGFTEAEIQDELVNQASRLAGIYDFVHNLPNGMSTRVGERGVKLSGGQRQRIGIARALYFLPEVLVLDEATSALDEETEMEITESLLQLKGDITIIAISHRMSTLNNCDFIVELKNGVALIQ